VVADYPIEKLQEEYSAVRWIFLADTGIPAKRNAGTMAAKSALVGFIDDDCVAQPGWVKAAKKFMELNPGLAGFSGQTLVERTRDTAYPVNEYKRLESPRFRTNNMFYVKKALSEIGGFDPRFTVQREDVDVAFSLLEKGLHIGHCEDSIVKHLHRAGEKWDLLKNCVNRRFDPLLYKKHRALYRQWIKTPFTPSIAAQAAFHGALVVSTFLGVSTGLPCAIDLGLSLALSIRRNRGAAFHGMQIARDCLSFFISPLVLLGALAHGSVTFRKVLFF
jgi:GT2 family glycosyltransferase